MDVTVTSRVWTTTIAVPIGLSFATQTTDM